jgi:transcriptional regulator with XRE-family HTH domain
MKLKYAVGGTIRKIRQEQGKSLRELSPYISIGHLSDTELGNKEMSQDLIDYIVSGLNMTTADFLMEVATYLKENEKENH